MKKKITFEETAALARDCDTLAIGGFGAYGTPDNLLRVLRQRYDAH